MTRSKLPARVRSSGATKPPRSCASHRAWVRKHHCSVRNCKRIPIECAHVRTTANGGMGLKPADRWCISLCAWHHAEQHRIGERTFSNKYDFDLAELASEFARSSPYRDRLV